MSLKFEMEQMPGYLAAKFIGSGVVEEVWRQFELITEHCKGAKNNKLLIDTTGAEGEISDVERFQFAERMEIFARYGIKVALACKREHIHPQGLAMLLAQMRGIDAEIFTDSRDAEEWLLN
jgi:hypothetical protein